MKPLEGMWTNRLDDLLKKGYVLMCERGNKYMLIGPHSRFDGPDLLTLVNNAWQVI